MQAKPIIVCNDTQPLRKANFLVERFSRKESADLINEELIRRLFIKDVTNVWLILYVK